MPNGDTQKCPLCGFEQNELCCIGPDGPEYACNNAGCRVSVFYPEGVDLFAGDGPNYAVETDAEQ